MEQLPFADTQGFSPVHRSLEITRVVTVIRKTATRPKFDECIPILVNLTLLVGKCKTGLLLSGFQDCSLSTRRPAHHSFDPFSIQSFNPRVSLVLSRLHKVQT